MKLGPIVHGVLLVVALGFGYRTLTEEEAPSPDMGSVVVWERPAESIETLTYDKKKKSVRLERRTEGGASYLWGVETRVETRDKEEPEPAKPAKAALADAGPAAAQTGDGAGDGDGNADGAGDGNADGAGDGNADGAGDGSADGAGDGNADGAGDGNADGTDAVAEGDSEKPERDTSEPERDPSAPEKVVETAQDGFPVGERGDEVLDLFATFKALRDLGELTDEQRATFELADSDEQLTVFFEGGTSRSLTIGGKVYGSSDRYIYDAETGHGYVVKSKAIRLISGGQTTLRLRELHGYDDGDVKSVAVNTGSRSRELVKLASKDDDAGDAGDAPPAGPHGEPRPSPTSEEWAYADAPDEPDQTLSNFLSRLEGLRPRGYSPDVDPGALTEVVTLRYRNEGGEELGHLTLYRGEEDDEAPAPAHGRPRVAPGPSYYIETERTRVLGKVSRLAAERVDQDLGQLFGDAGGEEGSPGEAAPAGEAGAGEGGPAGGAAEASSGAPASPPAPASSPAKAGSRARRRAPNGEKPNSKPVERAVREDGPSAAE